MILNCRRILTNEGQGINKYSCQSIRQSLSDVELLIWLLDKNCVLKYPGFHLHFTYSFYSANSLLTVDCTGTKYIDQRENALISISPRSSQRIFLLLISKIFFCRPEFFSKIHTDRHDWNRFLYVGINLWILQRRAQWLLKEKMKKR